ncbi:MAG: hypothetical protein KH297_04455 [Firmicutes bacterium]|nr:hypothetical protein [Bacillota bacterium]
MNRRIIGLAMITVTLAAIGIWEFWGRENISYRQVIVLREDTKAHTVISEDDIQTKKLESPSGEALTEADAENLIGMETSQYVAADTELRREYFQTSQFAVGQDSGKALMSLSSDWLLSFPQTLRRGDKVNIYNGTVKLMEAVTAHVKDSGGQEVLSQDSQRMEASSALSHIEIIGSEEDLVELSKLASEGAKFTLTTTR